MVVWSQDANWWMLSMKNFDKLIRVYPIPSNYEINLEIRESSSFKIEVFNSKGSRIKVDMLVTETGFRMNINSLNSGIYIIRGENERGDRFAKKFIRL